MWNFSTSAILSTRVWLRIWGDTISFLVLKSASLPLFFFSFPVCSSVPGIVCRYVSFLRTDNVRVLSGHIPVIHGMSRTFLCCLPYAGNRGGSSVPLFSVLPLFLNVWSYGVVCVLNAKINKICKNGCLFVRLVHFWYGLSHLRHCHIPHVIHLCVFGVLYR